MRHLQMAVWGKYMDSPATLPYSNEDEQRDGQMGDGTSPAPVSSLVL